MRWIYIIALITIFLPLAVLQPPGEPFVADIAGAVVSEAGVPNAVSGILLRSRLYDTLFELLVFMVAVLGVQYAFSMYKTEDEILYLDDPNIIILARIGAMISGMIFLELALRGHLAPGGGFAAGVAGGTAIGLLMLTGDARKMHDIHEKWKFGLIETGIVMAAFLIGIPFLLISRANTAGDPLGGIFIPVLNTLIAFKVALGSRAVIMLFIRHRGLL